MNELVPTLGRVLAWDDSATATTGVSQIVPVAPLKLLEFL